MAKNESYKTTVRYYNCRTKKDQKYITIELPVDSTFNPDDRVTISITETQKEQYDYTVSTDARLTAGSIMRQMDVGDTATFNKEKWGNLRTIASQIKEMYGSTFTVRKDKHRPENIIVTRIS